MRTRHLSKFPLGSCRYDDTDIQAQNIAKMLSEGMNTDLKYLDGSMENVKENRIPKLRDAWNNGG